MPPPRFPIQYKEREKREELKTYRELSLKRDLKSAAQRRRVEANGLRRVLGNGSATQPYLIVVAARYREVRLEIQRTLLLEAKQANLELAPDLLLRQLKPRIEALAYTQLAEEKSHEAFRHVSVAALGRRLTKEEQKRFAEAAREKGGQPANAVAQTALNHALGSIEERLAHNPARYQALWTQVVGNDAAQQSQLEQVDATTQTAWFRCYNSVLSSDLQRRRGLAEKLAKALGVPVRQLRARF
jgi:hypothetical protein